MNGKLSGYLVKFVDNAHLGKVATDLSPGMILTAAVILLVANFTQMDLLPYVHHREILAELRGAEGELRQLQKSKKDIQAEVYQLEIDAVDPAREKEKEKLKILQKQRTTALTEAGARIEAKTKEIVEIEKKLERALSSKTNVDQLTDHFVSIFFVGYVAGIILAQVSGGIFYNGLFYRYFKGEFESENKKLHNSDNRGLLSHGIDASPDLLEKIPNLEIEYYRYLEVAMNMILPVCLLALTFLAVGLDGTLWSGGTILSLVLFFVLLLTGWALYHNARQQYVGYFLKKAEVLTILMSKTGVPTS